MADPEPFSKIAAFIGITAATAQLIIDVRLVVAAVAVAALAGCGSSKPATEAAPAPAPLTSAPAVAPSPAPPSAPSSPAPVVASSPAAVALPDFCGLASSTALSGLFTRHGTTTVTFASPTCTYTSPSHNSTLAVEILTGAAATTAFTSTDYGPLLRDTHPGYGGWADGIKPATSGLGIIMRSGNAVCVATPSGAPDEFMPDEATRQHILALICYPILPKFNQ